MVLRGHFNGREIVLDDPVPPEVSADTPVTVHFENGDASQVLADLVKLAISTDLFPRDYSEQHDPQVNDAPSEQLRIHALRLVAKWYATASEKDKAYWDELADEIAVNRLSFGRIQDHQS